MGFFEDEIDRRAKERYDALVARCASEFGSGYIPRDDMATRIAWARKLYDERHSYPWRQRRRTPSLERIYEHHGLEPNRCQRCGTYCEKPVRAHIIDRFCGGLDVAANLAPLCDGCHRSQPCFCPGMEVGARDWFGLPPLDPAPVILAIDRTFDHWSIPRTQAECWERWKDGVK